MPFTQDVTSQGFPQSIPRGSPSGQGRWGSGDLFSTLASGGELRTGEPPTPGDGICRRVRVWLHVVFRRPQQTEQGCCFNPKQRVRRGTEGPRLRVREGLYCRESPAVASHSVSRGSTAGDGGAASSEPRGQPAASTSGRRFQEAWEEAAQTSTVKELLKTLMAVPVGYLNVFPVCYSCKESVRPT